MNSEKNAIVVLCATAVLLVGALLFVPRPASAEVSVASSDYSACTFLLTDQTGGGGDGLYIVDSRSGKLALFAYDFKRKTLEPLDIRPLKEAFEPR